jgi:hypothetical protein
MDLVRCEATASDPLRKTPEGIKWGYYYFLLLLDPNVQREIRLTSSQLNAVEALKNEYLDRSSRQPSGDVERDRAKSSPTTKNAAPAISKESSADLFALLSNKAVKLLTDQQRRRLGQVIFQLRKVEIFFYPEITGYLEFTQEQTKEVAAIRLSIIREARKLHAQYIVKEKDSREFQKRTVRLMEEGRLSLLKNFSPEQARKLESLEGRTISFDQTNLRFDMRRENPKKPLSSAKRRGEGTEPSAPPAAPGR